MKKLTIAVVIAIGLANSIATSPANAAVKTGTACTKLGSTSTVSGVKYSCIKSGKKLVWGKGTKVSVKKAPVLPVKPSPSPSPAASSLPTTAPNPIGTPLATISASPNATLDPSKIIVIPSPALPSTQLIPRLVLISKTFNSFIFQIENYDSKFNWRVEPSEGYASRDINGKVTITGLKPKMIISVRVTASRVQYRDGFETISVETAPESEALVPKLSVIGETSQEFYVKIENHDAKFSWNFATTKGVYEEKLPGLYRVYGFGNLTGAVFVLSLIHI